MSIDLAAVRDAVSREGRVARVVVAEAKGSAPREAGASMLVWSDGQSGTIGGGALEFETAARARGMLAAGGARIDRMALGPELQQCCGGSVTLVTEVFDAQRLNDLDSQAGLVVRAVGPSAEMPLAVMRRLQTARREGATGGLALIDNWLIEPLTKPARNIWIWGAGHVGRAIVGVVSSLPDMQVTWVDTSEERFPDTIPEGVEKIVAADLATLAAYAPEGAEHLILTYSHVLDLELCHALLTRGFAGAGLIGSKTKWARFRRRLGELGHKDAQISRIACPIGDPSLGKHPQAIAISVAAAILAQRRAKASLKKTAG